jgi:iron complex transport system substrate-binding protein
LRPWRLGVYPSFLPLTCNTDGMSDYAPRRVVSLQPSATVILRDLGQIESLVACTKYCAEVCPELRRETTRGKIAIVADSWTAQSQQISDAHPDLVIAAVPYQEKAVAEILKSGARFLGLAPKSVADICGDIAAIAGIMDAREEGTLVIQKMESAIEDVRQRTRNLPRLKVFCEEWGKPLIASQLWVAELVEAAGGEFMGKPGAQTDAAAVEAASPDVLIAAWCGAGDRVPLEKIIQQRKWENIPAVVNSRVYCIRDEYLNTPAPTLVNGLHALAAAIHPEIFPQADGLRCMNSSR